MRTLGTTRTRDALLCLIPVLIPIGLAGCEKPPEVDPYVPPDHVGTIRTWLTDLREFSKTVDLEAIDRPVPSETPLDPPLWVSSDEQPGDGWNTIVLGEAGWEQLTMLPDSFPAVDPDDGPDIRAPTGRLEELVAVVDGTSRADPAELAALAERTRYVVLLRDLRMPQRGRATPNLSGIVASPLAKSVNRIPDIDYTPCETEAEALVFDLAESRLVGSFPVAAGNRDSMFFERPEEGDDRPAQEVYQEQLERDAWRQLVEVLPAVTRGDAKPPE